MRTFEEKKGKYDLFTSDKYNDLPIGIQRSLLEELFPIGCRVCISFRNDSGLDFGDEQEYKVLGYSSVKVTDREEILILNLDRPDKRTGEEFSKLHPSLVKMSQTYIREEKIKNILSPND